MVMQYYISCHCMFEEYNSSHIWNKLYCYIPSAETKRDWLIHGHVALDKCNVSLGQQVKNCCPLRPAPYIKQNGGETRKYLRLNRGMHPSELYIFDIWNDNLQSFNREKDEASVPVFYADWTSVPVP